MIQSVGFVIDAELNTHVDSVNAAFLQTLGEGGGKGSRLSMRENMRRGRRGKMKKTQKGG